MLNKNNIKRVLEIQRLKIFSILCILVCMNLAGCGIVSPQQDPSTQETALAIGIQQTVLARQAEPTAAEQMIDQQATLSAQASQVAISIMDTQTSVQEQQTVEVPATTQEPEEIEEIGQAEQVAEQPAETEQVIDVQEMYDSANILLYEDVHYDPSAVRYYREVLNDMGLEFTDVGSAKGNLKGELYAGAPNGEPWDLVIIASEHHNSVPGEFYDYVLNALDKGSSVILEVFFVDKTYKSSAGTLLARCGVQFDKDWVRIPPQGMVLYPLDPTHPILTDPNSSLEFTDTTSYWAFDKDVGDLMKTTGKGDAKLLLGTKALEKNSYGTLTVCIDGRLIFQTFTSHNFTLNEIRPLLENYINNALKARVRYEQ